MLQRIVDIVSCDSLMLSVSQMCQMEGFLVCRMADRWLRLHDCSSFLFSVSSWLLLLHGDLLSMCVVFDAFSGVDCLLLRTKHRILNPCLVVDWIFSSFSCSFSDVASSVDRCHWNRRNIRVFYAFWSFSCDDRPRRKSSPWYQYVEMDGVDCADSLWIGIVVVVVVVVVVL